MDAGTYALTESGPGGYAACALGLRRAAPSTGATVTVPNGGNVTCTITNTDHPAKPDPGQDGRQPATPAAPPTPADWTLSAANGPTLVTGPGGSPEVTNQDVQVGTYALSESGGPDGYTAGDWSCTGATFTGGQRHHRSRRRRHLHDHQHRPAGSA